MGVDEGSLQVIDSRAKGRIGKLTYNIIIRYILLTSSACGVVVHTISYIYL